VRMSRATARWLNLAVMICLAGAFLAAAGFRGRLWTAWPWLAAAGAVLMGALHIWTSRIVVSGKIASGSERRGLIATCLAGAVLLAAGAIGTWVG
jgi:hypothetical protein